MRYLIPAAIAVAVTLVVIIVAWRLRAPEKPFTGESHIKLCMPLPAPFEIDPQQLARAYQQQWQRSLVCLERLEQGEKQPAIHTYFVSDGKCSLLLSASRDALPDLLINIALATGGQLDARQQGALKHSRGYLLIDQVIGSPIAPERAAFATRVALALLRQSKAVGCVNVSAQHYRPHARLANWLKLKRLASSDLATFLTSVEIDAKDHLLVTHGMEQFALPDMEITITDPNAFSYYQGILTIVTSRCIDHHETLKKGLVIHPLDGDAAFKIIPAPRVQEFQFGEFGAIALQKQ